MTKLIDTYGTYKLYSHEGRVYASKHDQSEELILELIQEHKLMSAEIIEDLRQMIDSANLWADTRGMYRLDEKDKGKSPIRANSFSVEGSDDEPLKDPDILFLNGMPFLVEKETKEKFSDFEYVTDYSLSAVPELVTEYQGHNIVDFDKTFFGIKQSLGPVDLTKTPPSELAEVVIGETVVAVMNQIDQNLGIERFYYKTLVHLKSVDDFVLFGYKDKIYALPEIQTATLLMQAEDSVESFLTQYTSGASTSEVIDLLSSRVEVEIQNNTVADTHEDQKLNEYEYEYEMPKLLRSMTETNIVSYKGEFFAIPKAAGHIDLTDTDNVDREDIIRRNTLPELLAVLGQKEKSWLQKIFKKNRAQQEYIERFGEYNIYLFEQMYFAIHLSLGNYDLSSSDYFSEEKVQYDTSLFGLREALSAHE